jgi:murein DD-endopeptidase MepM/ murein hydrolase activator NlpD
VARGTVKSIGYQGGYGNRTVITLLDGTDIWYCHQSRIAVTPGETVDPGQTIGYTGSTGNVTGPHLHHEVHPGGGGPVDPYGMLVQHGARP